MTRRRVERATLADVSALAGVSTITVSRFFNEPHRVGPDATARIQAAVEQLNYVPNLAAGGLASARNRVVAMVVPNISGPIFAPTLQALSDGLAEAGLQLLLASSYFSVEAEERAVRAFLGWNPAALVLTSRFHTPATERLIETATQPVIETWDLAPGRKPFQIGFSHRQVGRDAAEYLITRGHRRIGFVHNSAAGDQSAQERHAGYAEVMAAHGLEAWGYAPTERDPMQAGAQALRALVARKRQRPQALIFANDNLACGAVLAGQREGLSLPEDMAIFGFGDYAFADKLSPSLSTIRPPAQAIGATAVQLIRSLTEAAKEPPPQVHELACTLIARESA
jgi:LacI family transcriptional regulator, gluconate utilization system Gnt-I transcriptional repressor